MSNGECTGKVFTRKQRRLKSMSYMQFESETLSSDADKTNDRKQGNSEIPLKKQKKIKKLKAKKVSKNTEDEGTPVTKIKRRRKLSNKENVADNGTPVTKMRKLRKENAFDECSFDVVPLSEVETLEKKKKVKKSKKIKQEVDGTPSKQLKKKTKKSKKIKPKRESESPNTSDFKSVDESMSDKSVLFSPKIATKVNVRKLSQIFEQPKIVPEKACTLVRRSIRNIVRNNVGDSVNKSFETARRAFEKKAECPIGKTSVTSPGAKYIHKKSPNKSDLPQTADDIEHIFLKSPIDGNLTDLAKRLSSRKASKNATPKEDKIVEIFANNSASFKKSPMKIKCKSPILNMNETLIKSPEGIMKILSNTPKSKKLSVENHSKSPLDNIIVFSGKLGKRKVNSSTPKTKRAANLINVTGDGNYSPQLNTTKSPVIENFEKLKLVKSPLKKVSPQRKRVSTSADTNVKKVVITPKVKKNSGLSTTIETSLNGKDMEVNAYDSVNCYKRLSTPKAKKATVNRKSSEGKRASGDHRSLINYEDIDFKVKLNSPSRVKKSIYTTIVNQDLNSVDFVNSSKVKDMFPKDEDAENQLPPECGDGKSEITFEVEKSPKNTTYEVATTPNKTKGRDSKSPKKRNTFEMQPEESYLQSAKKRNTFELQPNESFLHSTNKRKTLGEVHSNKNASFSKGPFSLRKNVVTNLFNADLISENPPWENMSLNVTDDRKVFMNDSLVNHKMTQRRVVITTPPSKTSTPIVNKSHKFDSTKKLKSSLKKPIIAKGVQSSSKAISKPYTRTKLPNYVKIHKEALNKLESLEDHQQRKAERARLLLSGCKVNVGLSKGTAEKKRVKSPNKTPNIMISPVKRSVGFAADGAKMPKRSVITPKKKSVGFTNDGTKTPKRNISTPKRNISTPAKNSGDMVESKVKTPKNVFTRCATPGKSKISVGKPIAKVLSPKAKDPARFGFVGPKITKKKSEGGIPKGSSIAKPVKRLSPKLNDHTRFGFKVRQDDKSSKASEIKAMVKKTRVERDTVNDRRNAIKGVRSNRRFELLMKMRQESS